MWPEREVISAQSSRAIALEMRSSDPKRNAAARGIDQPASDSNVRSPAHCFIFTLGNPSGRPLEPGSVDGHTMDRDHKVR